MIFKFIIINYSFNDILSFIIIVIIIIIKIKIHFQSFFILFPTIYQDYYYNIQYLFEEFEILYIFMKLQKIKRKSY